MAIAIRQLTKHFVGEVSGVDLRQPLTKDEAAQRSAERGGDAGAATGAGAGRLPPRSQKYEPGLWPSRAM